MSRQCIKCQVNLPISDFRVRVLKNGKKCSENILTTCKSCERAIAQERRFNQKLQKKLEAELAQLKQEGFNSLSEKLLAQEAK